MPIPSTQPLPQVTISDEQILDSLLAFYRRKNMDFSHFFSEKTFRDLPIRSKINFIRERAAELERGVSSKWSPEDSSHLVAGTLDGIITGAAAGLVGAQAGMYALSKMGPIANKMARNKSVAYALATSAILGTVGGAMGAMASRQRTIDNRRALKNELTNVRNNPTIENTIGVFPVINSANDYHPLRDVILNRITDNTSKTIKQYQDDMPSLVVERYNLMNNKK